MVGAEALESSALKEAFCDAANDHTTREESERLSEQTTLIWISIEQANNRSYLYDL